MVGPPCHSQSTTQGAALSRTLPADHCQGPSANGATQHNPSGGGQYVRRRHQHAAQVPTCDVWGRPPRLQTLARIEDQSAPRLPRIELRGKALRCAPTAAIQEPVHPSHMPGPVPMHSTAALRQTVRCGGIATVSGDGTMSNRK